MTYMESVFGFISILNAGSESKWDKWKCYVNVMYYI